MYGQLLHGGRKTDPLQGHINVTSFFSEVRMKMVFESLQMSKISLLRILNSRLCRLRLIQRGKTDNSTGEDTPVHHKTYTGKFVGAHFLEKTLS